MAWVNEVGATALDSPTCSVVVPSGGYAAGTLLVAGVGASSRPDTIVVTDSQGNVWTKDVEAHEQTEGVTGKGSAYQFYATVTTSLQAGDAITVTFTSSLAPPARSVCVVQYFDDIVSGADVSSGLSSEGVQQKDITSGVTASTASANQLIVGVIGLNNPGREVTPGSGYTAGAKYTSTAEVGNRAVIMQWKYSTAIGPQEMTATTDASAYWAATVQTYALGASGTERSGQARVWTGGAWEQKPANVWNGTSWQPHSMKAWDGEAWRKAK